MYLKDLVNPYFRLSNLQLFSDDGSAGGNGDEGGNGDNGGENPIIPTVPKSQYDKLASQFSDLKKQVKAKETEDEKKAREQAEKDQEINELQQFKNKSILEKGLLTNGIDTESVELISEAVLSGDMESISKVFGEVYSKGVKELQKEIDALKLTQIDQPNGSTQNKQITVEDYKKMTLDERIALKNSNPELFNELNKNH